jgi:hypothetical protein
MFLAETVFQSMDSSLQWVVTCLVLLFFLILVAAAILESKLARLIRIQRAIYDLMMEKKEAEKKAHSDPTLPRPPLPVNSPRQSEAATAPKVYRID